MKPIYVTQKLEDWWIPALCIVDVALTIFLALVIAKYTSVWQAKALRKLPATFQNRTVLQGTMLILLILVASLLGRAILVISVHIIAIIWLASEIEKHPGRRLARQRMEQNIELELPDMISQGAEHRRNSSEQDSQSDELSISGPAMARITEPPPASAQDVPSHIAYKASEGEYQPGVQNGIFLSQI